MFYLKQYLPTINDTVYYSELTNFTYFSLLKYINNSDNRGVQQCFDEIVVNHIKTPTTLSSLDKFLILLDMRSICVGDSIELKLKTGNAARLSIFSILENIKSKVKDINFRKSCVIDDITLNLYIPTNILVDREDDIYESVVESVEFNGIASRLDVFTKEQKEEFFKSLPATAFNYISQYVIDVREQIKDINIINSNTLLEIEEVPFNLFDNTLFMFLKLLYTDDLMNFYEQQYSFIKKLKFTHDHFMKMTPNESRLFINLYNKDIKTQEDAKNKGSGNSPGGPLPAFASL